MNDSKLLFSTKTIPAKSNAGMIAAMIIMPIMYFLLMWLWLAMILSVIWIAVMAYRMAKESSKKKSYVEIYTDKVVGVDTNSDNAYFVIKYSDILRIDSQKDTVRIFCVGGSYTVRTSGSEQQVVQLIYQQKEKLAQ